MATKLKHQPNEQEGQGKTPNTSNVVAIGSSKCLAQDCKKTSHLSGFCDEHYEWFKWGLLTKTGQKPSDFDKKFMSFKKHRKAA